MAITTIKNELGSVAATNTARNRRAVLCTEHIAALALLCVMCEHHAVAAEWVFAPSISARETYSDNVNLQPSGKEQAGFVSEITPHFELHGIGRRLKLNATYSLDEVLYQQGSTHSSLRHELASDLTAELVDEWLYFDAKASVSQQSINVFGPTVFNNINATGNRAEIRTLSLSPYVRHRFSDFAKSELRYTHNATQISSSALPDTQNDAVSFVTSSGPFFANTTWGVALNRQNTRYANASSSTVDSETVNVRHLLIPTFAITGSAGYERYKYPFATNPAEGSSWTAGVAWRPSERTAIDASAGHRFFGKTFSVLASLRARHTVLQASYNEDITTTQGQFQSQTSVDTAKLLDGLFATTITDPIKRKSAVDAVIRDNQLGTTISTPVNGFTTRFFLQKAFQASLGFNGVRNTVLLSIFDTSRQSQNGQPTTVLPNPASNALVDGADNRQIGASGSWIWQIAPLSTANFLVTTNRIHAANSTRTERSQLASASLSHQFSRHVRGSVGVRRAQQHGSDSNSNLTENALFAAVSLAL